MTPYPIFEVHGPEGLVSQSADQTSRGTADVILTIGNYVVMGVTTIQGPKAVADLIAVIRKLVDRTPDRTVDVAIETRDRRTSRRHRLRNEENWTQFVRDLEQLSLYDQDADETENPA
jgi:hypothetical protein